MSIIAMTDRTIQALKAPDGQRADYYDKATPGLSLRVSPEDTRTWFLKYVAQAGEQRRLKLGRYPDLRLAAARRKAEIEKGRIAEGGDPAVEKKQAREAQREALTLAELSDLYMEQHAKPKKRSWRKDERMLRVYFPDWGKRATGEITDLDIDKRIREIARDHGRAMADRCLACIRKVFAFAIKSPALKRRAGRPAHNPARDVERPCAPVSRDRTYNDEEIKRLWPAFEQIGRAGLVFKLGLVTGQRLKEIAGMRWREIDGTLSTVPAERSKNKRLHIVPLSDLALEIIEPIRRLGSEYVFASPVSNETPIGAFGKPASRVQALSGIADFRSHDLRRSCMTGITRLGFPRFIADQVLGHVIGGIGATDDRHSYLKEKANALAAWERHLRSVLGLGGNAVSIATAQRA